MSAPHPCPPPDRLRAFALGTVPEREAQDIVEHLELCLGCEQTVDGLNLAGDTVVTALLAPAVSDPAADDLDCQRVEARVRQLAEELAGDADQQKADPFVAQHLGPYQLLEQLGSGGMGVVYKAIHRKLERVVALKVLPPARTRDRAAVARFEREIRAIGKLDHPHLVRATDAGEVDGVHYLVMELVDGLDLSTLLKHHHRFPVAEACEIIRQAALGLDEAHRNGMVHRDVKPSNLMLARSARVGEPPRVKILDLGLARLTGDNVAASGDLTSEHQVVGTIAYMAPEQFVNTHGVDIRADIYSLGATLYKLLTGLPPFPVARYPNTMAWLWALARDEIELIETHRTDVPAGLSDVVLRLLARDPDERYESPQDVVDVLQPYTIGHDLNRLWPTGEPAPPNSAPVPQPNRRRSRAQAARQRLAVWLMGVIAVLSIGGAMAFQLFRTDDPKADSLSRTGLPPGFASTDYGSSAPREPTLVDRHRRAVDWVLGIGGKATVTTNGSSHVLRVGDELPFNEYKLAIDLNRNPNVDDAGLENLRGATAIDQLVLNGTNISTLEPVLTLTNLQGINCSIDRLDAEDIRRLSAHPSLRRLALGIFASTPPPIQRADEAFAAACQFSQVDDFAFGSFYYSMSDAALAELRHMPQLRALHLAAKTLTDDGMRNLPALPEMTSLRLSCPQVTSAGLTQLDRHPKLESLLVDRLILNDDGIQKWPNLPRLHSLTLDECREWTGVALANWSVWPRLKSFRTTDMPVTDADLAALASGDPQVEWLAVINSKRLTDAALEALPAMKRIRHLDLTGCTGITDNAVPALSRLRGLRHIEVAGTSLSAAGVEALRQALPQAIISDGRRAPPAAAMPPSPTVVERNQRAVDWALSVGGKVTVTTDGQTRELQTGEKLPFNDSSLAINLNLKSTVDDAALGNLRDATAIRSLILVGTAVSSLDVVLTLKNLEFLGCSIDILDAADVRSLANLESLRHLQLGQFDSPAPPPEHIDEIFAAACRLPQVEQLGFGSYFYALSDAALMELREMPQLRILHLGSGSLTDEGLRNLPSMPELTSLSLGCPQLKGQSLSRLGSHPKLEELRLRFMALADNDFRELPDLLSLNLVEFFRCSKLTGTGLSQWRAWPRLKSLRTVAMAITDADVEALASVENRIESLAITGSPSLTDAGVESVNGFQRLAVLDLTDCPNITDAAIPALGRLKNLTALAIPGTGISSAGRARLQDALPETAISAE